MELKNRTVADIVSENIKTAHVFKKYNIDFCCGGGKSVEEACNKWGIDINMLENELNNAFHTSTPSVNYSSWSLDFLCDYIEQTHHKYVLESIPIIQSYLDKVAKVHGLESPETIEIKNLFNQLVAELVPHMRKEELMLFPYIRKMISKKGESNETSKIIFETIQNPISMMMHEHDHAGDLIKSINKLSHSYTTPNWACNTYKALYAKLEEFENDLHLHIHLENNILFPKAIKFDSK